MSRRPHGEYYGENDAIHEGDDGEVETERSLFCLRSCGGLSEEAAYASGLYLAPSAGLTWGTWLVVAVGDVLDFVIYVLARGWCVRINANLLELPGFACVLGHVASHYDAQRKVSDAFK